MPQNLSGTDKHDRVFLKIILTPAVGQSIGTNSILYINYIKIEVLAAMGHRSINPLSFHHVYIRVTGGDAPYTVEIGDRVNFYNAIHAYPCSTGFRPQR